MREASPFLAFVQSGGRYSIWRFKEIERRNKLRAIYITMFVVLNGNEASQTGYEFH
jgi:hypothetical protein